SSLERSGAGEGGANPARVGRIPPFPRPSHCVGGECHGTTRSPESDSTHVARNVSAPADAGGGCPHGLRRGAGGLWSRTLAARLLPAPVVSTAGVQRDGTVLRERRLLARRARGV